MTTLGRAQPTLDPAQVAQAKERILAARAEGYSGAYCASQVGIARRTLYEWTEADPEFAAAWQQANECHHDWYEDRLRDGAANGHDVAIIVGLKMAGRFVERQAPQVQVLTLYQVFQQILVAPESAPSQGSIIEHQAAPQLQGEQGAPQLGDGTTQAPKEPQQGRPSAKPASRRRPERTPLPR